jgi:hypothetical protein
MDYTTETITVIAGQVVQVMKETLKTEGDKQGIAVIETQLREILRQVGAAALGQYLSGLADAAEPSIACACGGEMEYQRQREASLLSVFGRVQYRRSYYSGCGCGKGQAPLDQQLGLKPGGVSAGLAELLALGGVELAFDQARRWVEKHLLFGVSENTIRSATEERGEQRQAQEKGWIAKSQDAQWLQDRLRTIGPVVPKRLYGSLDAAKTRIEPRCPEEKEQGSEAWRDLKVGCWYELEGVPAAQRSHRQQEKYDREQQVFRAKNLRYYCDLMEAKQFGQLVWATGCRMLADLAAELVFVCDGAVWIWNLVSQYYPHAVQIVDWYHATEHLEKIAAIAFSQAEERKAWLAEVKEALWQGQVQEVIRSCQDLAAKQPKVSPEIAYFINNEQRMDYARFRAAGYAIGSGTIESACKQIVVQRLRKSGAQWSLDGAVRTAKARAAWLSGEWDSLPLAI